jgi:hypothetical protein
MYSSLLSPVKRSTYASQAGWNPGRYIPAEPNESRNPVFSVHQTDIIHYGNDLADYFQREFQVPLPDRAAREPRPISVLG